jgi:predicted alpha/beta superfamily hydrolase
MQSPARLILVLGVALSVVSVMTRARAAEPCPPHESFDMASRATGDTRCINVYLPPGYRAATTTRFPVLYMPDGGEGEDFPHIATTIDAAIRAGEMRPLLLVGIENTERRRDMTGPTRVDEDRTIAPRVGGSAAFRAFIAGELIPQIESRYRVTGERGIIGESLAGLFIVETFFQDPGLFETSIALSPSLWWDDEELVWTAAARLKARPEPGGTLYLSSANAEEGIAPSVAQLAEALRADAPPGLRWYYEPRPDLRHDNIYRSVSPQVLRRMYPPPAGGADGK